MKTKVDEVVSRLEADTRRFMAEYKAKGPNKQALAEFARATEAIQLAGLNRELVLADAAQAQKHLDAAFKSLAPS